MKALFAAASAVAIACLAPGLAQAQTATNTGAYVNFGYGQTDAQGADLGALGGRAGYRFNSWLGAEGELAFGVKGDEVNVGGVDVDLDLEHQAAAYVVGFAPIGPNTDLLARVGYGTTKIEGSAAGVSASADGESWNWGVGAQHHFDGVNGVRVDWTRHEFEDGGDADVWAISYTRRF